MKKYNIITLKIEDIREMIYNGDDTQSNQIRVTDTGEVFLSTIVGFEGLENIRFRMGTFSGGYGYVGPEAANDENHIKTIYDKILKYWEIKVRGCVDCMI